MDVAKQISLAKLRYAEVYHRFVISAMHSVMLC
jgi:hypothetical protein